MQKAHLSIWNHSIACFCAKLKLAFLFKMSFSKLNKAHGTNSSTAIKRPKIEAENLVIESTSNTSSQHFNDLPDDVIILVFKHFPLQHCITQFRSICSRWNAVVLLMCGLKGSLKIIDYQITGVYCHEMEPFNGPPFEAFSLKPLESDDDLDIDTRLNSFQIQFLGNAFSNIKVLVIGVDEFSPFVPQLLRQWPALNSLTLCR